MHPPTCGRKLWPFLIACLLLLQGCPWPWGAAPKSPLSGRILDASGRPQGGILVRALFTNAIPFTNSTPLSVNAMSLGAGSVEVRTSSDGRFAFSTPPIGELNLEAVQTDTSKAVKLGVPVRAGVLLDVGDLRLAPTGTLVGQVTTPGVSGVNLLGTDVFIPGLNYLAKTDEKGNFRLDNLPAGTFRLVASNPSLGQGEVPEFAIQPSNMTVLAAVPIALSPPKILELRPAIAAPGASFDILGTNFGKSTGNGNTLEVFLNGLRLSDLSIENDGLIHARVPQGAQSGRVVVKVGLISGSSPGDFKVVRQLGLVPPGPLLLPLDGSFRFSAVATDSAGLQLPLPGAGWSAPNDGILQLDAATPGQGQGKQVGMALVSARNGDMSASALVCVSPLAGTPLGPWSPAAGATPSMSLGAGAAMAVWSSGSGESYQISGQRVLAPTWQPSEFALASSFSAPPNPAIAWDTISSQFWLAYADGAVGSRVLKLQMLDSSGTVTGSPVILSQNRPDILGIAIAPRGNDALISWQEPGGQLMCRLASQGTGAPIQVTASGARSPSSAWDGSVFVICWGQSVGNEVNVLTRAVKGTGEFAADAVVLASGAQLREPPSLAGGAGTMVALYSDVLEGARVLVARKLLGGVPVNAPVNLGASHVGHLEETRPSISWTGSRYLICWQDNRGDAPGLFAQTCDRDLTSFGPAFAVTLGGGANVPMANALGGDGFVGWLSGGAWFAQRLAL